jgi:lipopolysaccharide export system protein LptA
MLLIKYFSLYLAVSFALNLGIVSIAIALPNDRQQAINIESNKVQRNDKTGLTVYEGAVNIIQGTIAIKADKVTVHTELGKVTRIVCIGTPAHYEQLQDPESGLVTARANTIEYNLREDVIVLINNADLSQSGSILKGDRINYDLKQELVQAHGDVSGNKRIQMVIPSNQQPETD